MLSKIEITDVMRVFTQNRNVKGIFRVYVSSTDYDAKNFCITQHKLLF